MELNPDKPIKSYAYMRKRPMYIKDVIYLFELFEDDYVKVTRTIGGKDPVVLEFFIGGVYDSLLITSILWKEQEEASVALVGKPVDSRTSNMRSVVTLIDKQYPFELERKHGNKR